MLLLSVIMMIMLPLLWLAYLWPSNHAPKIIAKQTANIVQRQEHDYDVAITRQTRRLSGTVGPPAAHRQTVVHFTGFGEKRLVTEHRVATGSRVERSERVSGGRLCDSSPAHFSPVQAHVTNSATSKSLHQSPNFNPLNASSS